MTEQQPQPVIQTLVSDALARIETKVDQINLQLIGKADAAAVHELESRVRVLETTQASTTAVTSAISRARGAVWVAVGSLAAGISAVAYMIAVTRGH